MERGLVEIAKKECQPFVRAMLEPALAARNPVGPVDAQLGHQPRHAYHLVLSA